MTITVQHGQTLADIALRYYGELSAVAGIVTANYLNVTDTIEAGDVLYLPTNTPSVSASLAARAVRYFVENKLQPATNLDDTDLGGIDFWGVEFDFLVS